MDRFVSAFSAHPDARTAAGEILGHTMEAIPSPGTVLVGVSTARREHMANLMEAADALLSPSTLIGVESLRVGAGGAALAANSMVIWASSLTLRAQPLVPDETGSVAPGGLLFGRGDADRPLICLFDGSALDRDSVRDALDCREVVLGELELKGEALFYLGQERVGAGIVIEGFPTSAVWMGQGYSEIGQTWTVTATEPDLELAGQPVLDRFDELALDPRQAKLGATRVTKDGETVSSLSGPATDLKVGDLVSIWKRDERVFGEGLSCLTVPPGRARIGFGPGIMGSSPQYERTNSIDFSTIRQIRQGTEETYTDSWAYGALGFG